MRSALMCFLILNLNKKKVYLYIKALHIIFIVTWFSGMFYIVRLFVYHSEAAEKLEPERSILSKQYKIMIKRLWLGITYPSAVLTLIFGTSMWYLLGVTPEWLVIKLCFVVNPVLMFRIAELSNHGVCFRLLMRGKLEHAFITAGHAGKFEIF